MPAPTNEPTTATDRRSRNCIAGPRLNLDASYTRLAVPVLSFGATDSAQRPGLTPRESQLPLDGRAAAVEERLLPMKVRDELYSLLTILRPLGIFAGAMLAILS